MTQNKYSESGCMGSIAIMLFIIGGIGLVGGIIFGGTTDENGDYFSKGDQIMTSLVILGIGAALYIYDRIKYGSKP